MLLIMVTIIKWSYHTDEAKLQEIDSIKMAYKAI